ncbi:MAG TPA: HAD family hydrolase [Candidatus Binataceae bacterium]|nr:HAD family hydrolase [Candidatus Binataceae bacterium]
MATVTHLLFDFGGTLDGPAHWLDRFLAQYRAAGIEISRAELDPAFDNATRMGYRTTHLVGRFGLVDLVRFLVGNQFEYLRKRGPEQVRAMLEQGGPAGRHRVVEAVTASFVRETIAGMEHSRETLTPLKANFTFGVVSNFYGNLGRILAEARMDTLFSAVIDSSRIGIFKPDPAIFAAALKRMHAMADCVAVIGDSLSKDIVPAKSLGMRTVWYRAAGRTDAIPANVPADFTIDSLGALLDIKW